MSRKNIAKPSLEYLKKAAKKLLKRVRKRDKDAVEQVNQLHPVLALSAEEDFDAFKLADAQYVIARSQGEASWAALKAAIDANVIFYEEAIELAPEVDSISIEQDGSEAVIVNGCAQSFSGQAGSNIVFRKQLRLAA